MQIWKKALSITQSLMSFRPNSWASVSVGAQTEAGLAGDAYRETHFKGRV